MAESIWTWEPPVEADLVSGAAELPALAWAREVKADLVELQRRTTIPAAGAVAQLIHEAWNAGGRTLSRLAADYHNYAGLKWVRWQREFGGRPVSLSTWEEINGEPTDQVAAFCAFPSWEAFLGAYAALLQFDRYRGALTFASQPLLWLHQVVTAGYATDTRYLGGTGHWLAAVWPLYADTVATSPTGPVVRAVPILTRDGQVLANGWLQDPDGPGPEGERVVARVRELEEAKGLVVEYDAALPAVLISWPGSTPAK